MKKRLTNPAGITAIGLTLLGGYFLLTSFPIIVRIAGGLLALGSLMYLFKKK